MAISQNQADLKSRLRVIQRAAEERDAERRAQKLNIPYVDLRKIPVSIDAVNRAGGRVVRIGALGAAPVAGVVDCSGAEDWFDTFLISQCAFFVGNNSGPSWVAGSFGVPCLITNWSPVAVPFKYPRTTLLEKTLRDMRTGMEVVPADDDPMRYVESESALLRMGVVAKGCAPEEIAAAAAPLIEAAAC